MMMPRMMKPITAMTLMIEKTNSASPYPGRRVSEINRNERRVREAHTLDTEEVDHCDGNEEDRDPDCWVDVFRAFPEANGDGCGDDFERKRHEPQQSVVPTHSETPSRRQSQ